MSYQSPEGFPVERKLRQPSSYAIGCHQGRSVPVTSGVTEVRQLLGYFSLSQMRCMVKRRDKSGKEALSQVSPNFPILHLPASAQSFTL